MGSGRRCGGWCDFARFAWRWAGKAAVVQPSAGNRSWPEASKGYRRRRSPPPPSFVACGSRRAIAPAHHEQSVRPARAAGGTRRHRGLHRRPSGPLPNRRRSTARPSGAPRRPSKEIIDDADWAGVIDELNGALRRAANRRALIRRLPRRSAPSGRAGVWRACGFPSGRRR